MDARKAILIISAAVLSVSASCGSQPEGGIGKGTDPLLSEVGNAGSDPGDDLAAEELTLPEGITAVTELFGLWDGAVLKCTDSAGETVYLISNDISSDINNDKKNDKKIGKSGGETDHTAALHRLEYDRPRLSGISGESLYFNRDGSFFSLWRTEKGGEYLICSYNKKGQLLTEVFAELPGTAADMAVLPDGDTMVMSCGSDIYRVDRNGAIRRIFSAESTPVNAAPPLLFHDRDGQVIVGIPEPSGGGNAVSLCALGGDDSIGAPFYIIRTGSDRFCDTAAGCGDVRFFLAMSSGIYSVGYDGLARLVLPLDTPPDNILPTDNGGFLILRNGSLTKTKGQ